jgi:inorganic pyrophosphatase
MDAKYKLIKSINVNRANFEHIAQTGNINGILLTELYRVMEEYKNLSQSSPKEEEKETLEEKYNNNPFKVNF